MSKESPWFRNIWPRVPPLGLLTLAALVICTGSGVVLAMCYRSDAALDSLALLMMKSPVGVFTRSLHYWSAQAFLIGCLVHVVDHLAKRSETLVGRGVWLRLSLLVPVILYAMLSGFLLRADPASIQAGLIFRALLRSVPSVGDLLSWALLGQERTLSVLFLHHVCTATLVIWLVTIEHSRRILAGHQAVAWVLAPVAVFALLLVPGLESAQTAVEKGPWYLAGLQEVLHWLPRPAWAVLLTLLALAGLAILPWLQPSVRTKLKRAMAAGFFLYAILSVVALVFRGEGWRFTWVGANIASEFRSLNAYASPPQSLLRTSVPMIDRKREGCLSCHQEMTGFRPAHDPKRIGCASCHQGERFTLNKSLAHRGMTLTPGNFSVVRQTCASANCHSEMDSRLRASLMSTMSGVVAVDRVVFGESRDLNRRCDVRQISRSPADRHLRTLCASCHLGQDKAEPDATSELSRGGGCSACHLDYSVEAREELHRRTNANNGNQVPRHHPDISVAVQAQSCFGCHSRSGRISLAYEGWHETILDEASAKRIVGWQDKFRILTDGRVLEKHETDIHFQKGMQCVDCHIAAEVMGDGRQHSHKENALKVACVDCHPEQAPRTATFERLDPETQKIVALRRLNEPGRKFLLASSGLAYPNVFLGIDGQVLLKTLSDLLLEPKPASTVCGRDIAGHRKLECRACHSAWTPQCIICHTSFDSGADGWDHLSGRMVKGVWREQSGDLLAEPPVLGVEKITLASGASEERFTTFAPGMVMTLTRATQKTKRTDEFHRLYAPVSPHTSTSKPRNCVSCHANPAALGYGRGKLTYEVRGGIGRWTFEPRYSPDTPDGLPPDAWIGFLQEPPAGTTTRSNCRPFSLREQQKMLLVGACLQCHNEREPCVAPVFSNFDQYHDQIGEHCRVPDWAR